MRRSPPRLRTALAALAAALAAVSSQAYAAIPPGGISTLERRVVGGDADKGFQLLRPGPGESRMVREEGLGEAQHGRERRRRSLLYFAQLSDFQLPDEESPARVEFLDRKTLGRSFVFAQRPQEALAAHGVESTIRQINRLRKSPVAQAGGDRAGLALAVVTGDLVDSRQLNEVRWVFRLLDGGEVEPGSGRAAGRRCPPGTPGVEEAPRYTGVQDTGDGAETGRYYDPDRPAGRWAAWPRYPGLLDRAQQPFFAEGLDVPSYLVRGNHDALVQGLVPATAALGRTATGCVKPLSGSRLGDVAEALDPGRLGRLLASGEAMLVPPDGRRRSLQAADLERLAARGQDDAHGLALVDTVERRASSGAASYYAWTPAPGVRLVVLDTVAEGGSPSGNLDDPQFRWLERELGAAERAGELVLVFGHHSLGSLDSPLADEQAPPCGENPGCDLDPRSSMPVHGGDGLVGLLLAHPNAIAYVSGHIHEHRIEPVRCADGDGGFWAIETASLADWPQQGRVLELMDNGDGTLSLFATVVDGVAAATAPPPATEASSLGPMQLASIGRTLAYNDPQLGAGTGTGAPEDRNVELLVRDPRRGAEPCSPGSGAALVVGLALAGAVVLLTAVAMLRARR